MKKLITTLALSLAFSATASLATEAEFCDASAYLTVVG